MDAVVAILAIAALFYSFRKIGWWKWFWVGQTVLLGGFELGAKIVTGKTLSQQFWAYMAVNPVQAWVAIATLLILAAGLAIHLAWKWLKNRKG